ncbi:hypothetical protein [Moorena sp. SIO3H5]|uniref:hypothetical protein n=1 Tax=Moorena sp. SIO3H5 TaxID=2607834 RepID=UPI0013BA1806|nr:hypothetical protein [Moorena sp. SIO3H5]NEO72790.1 hypothetical protein [Moorena sp. SIO3H5]
MKIENLENLQEINTEELSSLEGGRMIAHPVDIRDMIDIKEIEDLRIDPHPSPMPEPKPSIIAKPVPLPRPNPCYYPLPPKCGPVRPYCYVLL